MSNQQNQAPQGKMFSAFIVGAMAFVAWEHFGSVMQESGEINDEAALTAAICTISALSFTIGSFSLLADWLELVVAKTPIGLKGTARFVRSLREVKHDLISHGFGPYWGVFKGTPVFADFEASAYTIGPSGSGKTTKVVQPMTLALKGKDRVILDFKSELQPILANTLRAQGVHIRTINLGDLFTDQVGESDTYNPLCLIADLFWQDGGLQDITDTLHQLCLQIYPEPKGSNGGQDDNIYFRDGSRRIISLAIQSGVLIYGYNATLGDVLQMVNNPESLLKHAQWAAGKLVDEDGNILPAMPVEQSPWVSSHSNPQHVQNYIAYYRALASGVVKLLETPNSNGTESFLSGAQNQLARFNITTRAHHKTSKSSFRFSELKESKNPTAVFIMLDPNKVQAQAPVLGVILWAMLFELKKHPDKHHPVYIEVDEASNVPWADLGTTLTWSRSFGLRFHFIFQNLAAFKAAHGEATLNILQSEAEIVQILAGVRESETLKFLETLLSQRSVVTRTSQKTSGIGIDSTSFSEDGRPLMSADEIRWCKKGILLIRQNRPMLIDLPSIAEIAPWRKQIGINPYHKKPYLKRVTLRIGDRKGGMLRRLFWWLSRS
jgi:type IV secretion system protein VirD4